MASYERHTPLPLAAARAALERLIESGPFKAAPQLTAFLRYVVETTLNGHAELIKAYTIAVEALGRPQTFDPASDAIVRVEAGRLRAALARYYDGDGADDSVIVDLPRGGYVPQFRWRDIVNGATGAPKRSNDGTTLQVGDWRTRNALESALALMESRAAAAKRRAQKAREHDRTTLALLLDERADEWRRQAETIDRLIQQLLDGSNSVMAGSMPIGSISRK